MQSQKPHSQRYRQVLKETSRAFYLSLTLLPKGARRPLSLAYLLARAADTVADSPVGQDVDRVETLKLLQGSLFLPEPSLPEKLLQFTPPHQGEARLLQHLPELTSQLSEESDDLRVAIQSVVSTLIDGMLWDQDIFEVPYPDRSGLSQEQLERYTFLVAGCVGPFWSFACARGDERLTRLESEDEMAVEFGKALQWVNILRDIPQDQSQGRYYLPALESPQFTHDFVYGTKRALRAFESACRYPLLFPRTYLRHRLAVFLPLVLGLRTIELLLRAGGPRLHTRVKVTREEVFFWLAAGILVCCSNRGLTSVLRRLHRRSSEALSNLETTFV